MKSILTVIGTRPEAIKLAPILTLLDNNKLFESKVCITKQHTDILDPFLNALNIKVDYQLENYESDGILCRSAAHILKQFGEVLEKLKPDILLVQGDTTTAFIAALAAFYLHIPVAHVEAGLRTGDLLSPWPEEAHRCLIDQLATYFFAPTLEAKNALLAEGVSSKRMWVVGNTSIDSMRLAHEHLNLNNDSRERLIIVTIHRRETQGIPLEEICHALRIIAEQFLDIKIIFFLHPNPAVCIPVINMLSGIDNIDLVEPTDHFSFIQLLSKSVFVITDSGGVQEEVTFIGKPVLVVRNTTERIEGIQLGTAKLVGTKSLDIVNCCRDLLQNPENLAKMSKIHFPYGDGYASERIVSILEKELK